MRIFAQNKDMPINVNIKISNPGLESLIITFKNQIMDAIQELSEKIGQVEAEMTSLRADLTEERQQINEKLDGLESQNQALADEVANLRDLLDDSEPEIAAAIARLGAIQTSMAETREEIRSIVADPGPEDEEEPEA
jgi:chromosome segregation ATPase